MSELMFFYILEKWPITQVKIVFWTEDDIEDVFTEAENSLMTTIPSNLKQLLIINGYEDKKALSSIDDQVLDSIEEFAREVIPSLI